MYPNDESPDHDLSKCLRHHLQCFSVREDSSQIVLGIRDIKLKEKLLRMADLTLETAVKICVAQETAEEQMKSFQRHLLIEANISRL